MSETLMHSTNHFINHEGPWKRGKQSNLPATQGRQRLLFSSYRHNATPIHKNLTAAKGLQRLDSAA
jgi:hypothetical protein